MAAGLTRLLLGVGASPQRRLAFLLVIVAVLIVHAWTTQHLADRLIELDKDAAMPARIEVAYVREMALNTPPPAAAPAAAAAPRARPRKVPKAATPASAPDAAASAASAPVVAARSVLEPPPDLQPPIPAPEPASQPVPEAAPASDPALAAAAPASSPASAPASFEWPASTRMSYLLTGNVQGAVEGSAQVEWIRAGSRYQVHLDLVVGPSFAPVATRRMSSDGEITEQGLVPHRFDQQTRAFGTDRGRATVLFEPDSVVLANGERQATVPGVQDTASQFVQLTYVFSTRPDLLRVGGTVDIPLALPHKVDVWIYDVVEEEVLYTNFGPLPSIHIKPRRAPKPGSLSAEIWFAPQLRYLPVRILIRQTEQTYVDLLIEKKPQMSAQ
jgi:hypothetical protein